MREFVMSRRAWRCCPTLAMVYGTALVIAAGPLPAALVETAWATAEADHRTAANAPTLVDPNSPGPGPLLHKPAEQVSPIAWDLVSKCVCLPANLRRHSGRAPHAIVLTDSFRPATLHSEGIRLQI